MKLRFVAVLVLAGLLLPPAPAANGGWRTWSNRALYGGTSYQVTVHPTRSGVVFAATTHGLFVSSDGGRTWTRTARNLNHADRVFSVTFAPQHPSVAYMVADSGLYRSADSARTWARVNRQYLGGPVAVSPTDPQVLFGDGHAELARSTDGGATWTPLRDGLDRPLHAAQVAVAPTDPSLVYALGTFGYRSTDGGQTWGSVATPEDDGVHSYQVDPRDSLTILATSTNSVYKSSDGAKTWTKLFEVAPPGPTTLHRSAADPDVIYLGTYFQGIYRSTNGGTSWRQIKTGLPRNETVLSIATARGGAVYAAMLHRAVYRWNASQGRWRWRSNGVTAPYVGTLRVARSKPSILYAGGHRAGVARSTDGGASWRWRGLSSQTIQDLAVHPNDAATVYAAGRHLYRTRDGGATWRRVKADLYHGFRAVAVAPSRPSTVYAATWGEIFRSTDSGRNWRRIKSGGAVSIAVHPTRRNVVFLGSNERAVTFSRDGGATWRDGCCIHQMHEVEDIAFEPGNPSRMYVATDGPGVYRSSDAGRTWRLAPDTPTSTLAVEIDRRRPNVVYVAATDEAAGVYVSTDRGRTFSRMASGMGRSLVAALALTPSGNVLHAGTTADAYESGQGVWSYRFR